MTHVHGTSVVIDGVGVLLRGPSGSGKSDVALRLIDAGAHLIADDQTVLSYEDGRLVMTSDAMLEGLLEVRGVGVVAVPCVPKAPLGLVVDLVPVGQIERMPETTYCDVMGTKVRLLRLPPFAASTPAKLRLAITALDLDAAPPQRPGP